MAERYLFRVMTGRVPICTSCGAVVDDIPAHDRYHDLLRKIGRVLGATASTEALALAVSDDEVRQAPPKDSPAPPGAVTWHIAECQHCRDVPPQLFLSEPDRDDWARLHADRYGHHVRYATEIRPPAGEPGDA